MKNLKFSNIIYRFISSILFFNIINLFKNNFNYDISFMQNLGIIQIILSLVIIFIVISILNHFIKKEYMDYILTIIFLFICSIGWLKDDNIFFVLFLFLLFLLLYHFRPKNLNINFNMLNKSIFKEIIIVGIIMFLCIAITGILRYKLFGSPNFDFGIPGQNFYYLRKLGIPLSTCERDMLVSHLNIHFSPIYYLILPIYFIFPHITLLQIISALLISSGVIPIYLLCKKYKLPKLIILLICLIFCIYTPAICSTYYDFHENHFLIPLLLWLFYFYEKNGKIGIIIFSLLVLLVKEDAPIYLIIFSIFMIYDKKKQYGIPILIVSGLYFIIVTYYLKTYGSGIMMDRYGNLMFYSGGMMEIIKTILINPGYFLKQLIISSDMGTDKIKYILQLFLPLGFIPLYSKEKRNYILLMPLLLTLMTTYQYSYDINFHYSCGIIAFLFYLFIKNVKEINIKNYLLLCAIISILIFRTYAFPKIKNNINFYVKEKHELVKIEKLLKEIPKDASVNASTFILPHLVNRDIIYEVYYHGDIPDVDYVVLDTRYDNYMEHYDNYIKNGYTEYQELKNKILILKK